MIQVIGLSGKAGSGKDYIAANILTKHYGYVPFSLAWHIKTSLIGKSACTYEEAFRTKPPRVRHLLQQEGTESGRDIYGEDIWLHTAYAWMQLIYEQWGIVRFVIPDVRFPNEVEYIQRNGGKVLRVIAPQRVADSPLSMEARLHRSETALDDYPLDNFDGLLDNDVGSESTLTDRVYTTLNTLDLL
jgi:hypothetical protein